MLQAFLELLMALQNILTFGLYRLCPNAETLLVFMAQCYKSDWCRLFDNHRACLLV